MDASSPKTIGLLVGISLVIIMMGMHGDRVASMFPEQLTEFPGSRSLDRKYLDQNISTFFEKNIGQTDESVEYLSRGKDHVLFLTADKAILTLNGTRKVKKMHHPDGKHQNPDLKDLLISISTPGANTAGIMEGMNELPGKSNYLIGNDPDKWHKNVPHYEMVRYNNLYNGIDLVYHNRKGNLEYDFILSPGADPDLIRLNFSGAEELKQDAAGNLVLQTRLGDVIIKAPETYQEIEGEKVEIPSAFEVHEEGQVSFLLAEYDRSKSLVIDPELVFSTYLGGEGSDGAHGIDIDMHGNAYITGLTSSADFPAGPGSVSLAGETDVFVTKLNTQTSQVIFTTFLGGTHLEHGLHLGLDDKQQITVAGWTCSYDFPVKNAIQANIGDRLPGDWDSGDVFALKLDADGSSLIYSTYLGGREEDELCDAVFDPSGNLYLSGYTEAYNFGPDKNCYSHFPCYPKKYEDYPDNCGGKHFVTKLNASGELQYSMMFQSTAARDNCLAVNQDGKAYFLQWYHHPPWPAPMPPRNLYTIMILNAAGTGLSDSLGILLSDKELDSWAYDLELDEQENIYIAGVARGDMIPVTAGAYQSTYVDRDAYVVKLNKNASEVLYASYLGGVNWDYAEEILIDDEGCILVYGDTESPDFPIKNANQFNLGGQGDVFLAKIDPSKSGDASLVYSSYLGGEKYDACFDMAIDNMGNIYLTGQTWSENFPVNNGLSLTAQGRNDGFVAVFGPAINLIYDQVVISGPPIFTPLWPSNTQQVLPQYILKDTQFFVFLGRSTDGRVGLRVTNTFVDPEPPLVLDMKVWDPQGTEIPTWTIHNIGEGNRGVQFDVTQNGFYRVMVWADPNLSNPPAPFQIHLAGNVGWPQPLLFPIPNTPPQGDPDGIRATRQDILINAPAPRPQLVRGQLGQVQYNTSVEVSQTSLFKFVNIFRVSEHAVAVLTPFGRMGFEQGRAPVRMLDPNPMIDITTPTAPFNNTISFPGGGYVVDFTQVPVPAAINVPVQLRHAAVLGKSDGIAASLPVQIPYKNAWISTPTFILDMGSGQEIVDGEGFDFQVISPDGDYRVAVSNTVFANTFIPIGDIYSGDQEFDLSVTSLRTARYVRIIAEPSVSIDAVKALNYFCDEIRTDIGPISKVSHITLTTRRSKAPATLFDPLIELIAPDGALMATNESGFGDDLSQNSSDAALINMELNQEGFYRYLGRGHDKVPNQESFGAFYTRYESAGSYDQNEIAVSEQGEIDLTAQRKVKITKRRQRDSYLFQAAPNQIINISVSSSEIDVMLELFDPEGFLIAACDNHPGRLSNAMISIQLPDSSFVGQAPLPALNTYRVVVSAIDRLEEKKSVQAGGAYIRTPAIGEYEVKLYTSDELVDVPERKQPSFKLKDNYPNPFSQQTALDYEVPITVHVSLEIYDLNGRLINQLVNQTQAAGKYSVKWKGNDGSGSMVADGSYICRMKAGSYTSSITMILYR